MPPCVAAFAAPRALQSLGCCEMLSPKSLLGHGALQLPGGRGEAAFHYNSQSHLVVQSTVKGGDP